MRKFIIAHQSISTSEANYPWLVLVEKVKEKGAGVSVACFVNLLRAPIFPVTTSTQHVQFHNLAYAFNEAARLLPSPHPHNHRQNASLRHSHSATAQGGGPSLSSSHVLHHITSCSVNGTPPFSQRRAFTSHGINIDAAVFLSLRLWESPTLDKPEYFAAHLSCFSCRASWMIHHEGDLLLLQHNTCAFDPVCGV